MIRSTTWYRTSDRKRYLSSCSDCQALIAITKINYTMDCQTSRVEKNYQNIALAK